MQFKTIVEPKYQADIFGNIYNTNNEELPEWYPFGVSRIMVTFVDDGGILYTRNGVECSTQCGADVNFKNTLSKLKLNTLYKVMGASNLDGEIIYLVEEK